MQPRPIPLRKTGRAEGLGELAQLALGPAPVDVGAGHDRRPLGARQQLRRLLHPVRRLGHPRGDAGGSARPSMKTTSSG